MRRDWRERLQAVTKGARLLSGVLALLAAALASTVVGSAEAAEIIIDTGQAGTSSTGTWCVSGATGFYGTNSLYSCGSGADTYRWTPTIPATGQYKAYVWWTSHPNRSTSVPYTLVHAGGTFNTTKNQQTGGGQWQLLGTFTFNTGTAGYLQVSDANGQAAADATRWVSTATKLAITSVNGGTNPTAGVSFPVVVAAQDNAGAATAVASATAVTLSLRTGTGTLGGTLTGTITAGSSQVTISGVTYTKAEGGVVLTATRISGDALTAGDSASVTVNPGAAVALAFTTQPANAAPGTPIPGPPAVTGRDSQGNTVTSSAASLRALAASITAYSAASTAYAAHETMAAA